MQSLIDNFNKLVDGLLTQDPVNSSSTGLLDPKVGARYAWFIRLLFGPHRFPPPRTRGSARVVGPVAHAYALCFFSFFWGGFLNIYIGGGRLPLFSFGAVSQIRQGYHHGHLLCFRKGDVAGLPPRESLKGIRVASSLRTVVTSPARYLSCSCSPCALMLFSCPHRCLMPLIFYYPHALPHSSHLTTASGLSALSGWEKLFLSLRFPHRLP